MKRSIACLILFVIGSSQGLAQDITAYNVHVGATVETLTGRVTIRLSPGSPSSSTLSYPEKSFLSVLWNKDIYTNNNVGVNLSGDLRRKNLSTAVNQRYGDTIRTVWNAPLRTITQVVYPVDLGTHGQVVIRWMVENKDSVASVLSGAQFLLDLQIPKQDSNDARAILTRYGYNQIWEKIVSSTAESPLGLPTFYTSFSHKPRSPMPASYITATGYTSDVNYKLGLKKPRAMTIGDWALPFSSSLVDNLWGASPAAPWISSYSDAAILFEWDSVQIPPLTTVEVGSMSYGTGKIHTCDNNLVTTGMMYPEYLVNPAGKLEPQQFEVNAFVFDQILGGQATTISMALEVGPHLRIVSPDTGKTSDQSQRQRMEPTRGFIADVGATTAAWIVAAEMPHCQGDVLSWLKVTTNGTDTCTYTIKIDCDDPTRTVVIANVQEAFELIGNPASDRTILRLMLSQPAVAFAEVFDVTGRSVASHQLGALFAGLNEYAMSTAHLQPGVYYVALTYGSKRETRKLIVR